MARKGARSSRLAALSVSLVWLLLVAAQCPYEYPEPDPVPSGCDVLIQYVTYETTELGPDPIHKAGENEKFVVLDMVIANNHAWKNFLVHRMDYYLTTTDQRFSTGYGASQMPDLRYPISNNSEILPGGEARHMTFFRVPNNITTCEFEYDAGWPSNFDSDDVCWVEVDSH